MTANIAKTDGGAVHIDGSQEENPITSCTFSANASTKGGAVSCSESCQIKITSSILYGNFPEEITTPAGTVTATYSDVRGGGYGGVGMVDKKPWFGNAPLETTLTSDAGTTTKVLLGYATKLLFNGFVIEIADDGVARTVTNIFNDEITFAPPLPGATVAKTRVDVWGPGATDMDVDLYLQSGSPCIDAANGDVAPQLDLDGLSRYDDPLTPNTGAGTPNYADMGAYEYQGE
ncbi:MAG: hypothetical protein MUC50_14550 [Myxococcota bacterium]|nr:hypothetical protein [Myxococcota bacterium]